MLADVGANMILKITTTKQKKKILDSKPSIFDLKLHRLSYRYNTSYGKNYGKVICTAQKEFVANLYKVISLSNWVCKKTTISNFNQANRSYSGFIFSCILYISFPFLSFSFSSQNSLNFGSSFFNLIKIIWFIHSLIARHSFLLCKLRLFNWLMSDVTAIIMVSA